MVRSRNTSATAPRQGFILLVVISMLVLFSLLGIAFVIYAQAEADIAKAARDAEVVRRPDMDPELLLSFFLGQIVYDTNDTTSGLRGHSLARTMYGAPGNVVPFNGTGRIPGAKWTLDYTNYGGAPRYPDGSPTAPFSYPDGSPNPPYTYPDANNAYLAAVKADGTVLMPSYYRVCPAGTPGAVNYGGKWVVSMRPNATYHPSFPAPDGNGLDVRNLSDSAAGYNGGANDSPWIYAGAPVMKAPDGRKYTACVAPLIVDLDNRINANVHGMVFSGFESSQGWGIWETNPVQVLGATDAMSLRNGNGSMFPGRYDQAWWPGASLQASLCPQCTFNSPANLDCNLSSVNDFGLPTVAAGLSYAYPQYGNTFLGGSGDAGQNARMYNFFDPKAICPLANNSAAHNDFVIPVSSMEALLRYGDTGSPALTSPLFGLCPNSLANSRTRRLVTTHSFDMIRPGMVPYWTTNAAGNYTLPNTTAQGPSAAAVPFPGAPAAAGEFNPTWQSISAGLRRLDLNRTLTDYPAVASGIIDTTNPANATQLQQALTDRQNFAQDIFNTLQQVTGAPTLASLGGTTTGPDYDALRWLAQLSVNIVDFLDDDDYSTPFNWNPAQAASAPLGWVFGTELPRLVINEAYAEINNDPTDPKTGGKATKDYKVNFWVELHNPVTGAANNPIAGGAWRPLADGGIARLFNPKSGTAPGVNNINAGGAQYPVYQFVVANADTNNPTDLRKNDNVLGDPDYPAAGAKTLLVVNDYTPATTQPSATPPGSAITLTLSGDSLNQVLPATGATSGAKGSNQGYFVLGPAVPFPGTSGPPAPPNFFVSLAIKDDGAANGANHNGMAYTLKNNPNPFTQPLPTHTLLLRRLACPYLPPQPTAGQPNYNPYITTDYIDQVPCFADVAADTNGMPQKLPAGQPKVSLGRKQPYAAAVAQLVQQALAAPPAAPQPQNTFFQINSFQANQPNNPAGPTNPPYDWLFFADRNIASPLELLNVSGYKPHLLTQQFMNPTATDPKFNHRAPWFDEDLAGPPQTSSHRLYRFFEAVEGGYRIQRAPIGGRIPGRININTIWDPETFNAMCDAENVNLFTQAGVNDIYGQMLASRTPGGAPGPSDVPFWGYSAGLDTSNTQYPIQNGINLTMFRPSTTNAGLRMFEPKAGVPGGEYHNDKGGLDPSGTPYIRFELMSKIFNTVTTRSNVFAVYLTVGFFEADDTVSPPRIGAEIGSAEGRTIRHRMFAIVDRSAMTTAFQQAAGAPAPTPGTPGLPPVFLEGQTAVATPGAATITVPTLNGNYDGLPWSIAANSWLVVDSGDNQEVVQVTGVGANSFTAAFQKTHPNGFAISNALPGNPGPQPRFDVRNPSYGLVVRYFSIVQ